MRLGEDLVCKTCLFWDSRDLGEGLCRQAAPSMVDDVSGAQWPITEFDEWCGDYKANYRIQKQIDEMEENEITRKAAKAVFELRQHLDKPEDDEEMN